MILVTGGSAGIGFACAVAALERTPSRVLITGRSAAHLESARARIPADLRARLDTRVCDQSRRADVDALVAALRATDAIEAAVLGVGVNPLYAEGPRRIHRLSAATIEATIATNCTHTLLITAALLDRFRQQRHGVLVWIGSQAAAAGPPGAALYCATKSFLGGLARSAASEYASHGVRVHVAHPGMVRTPRTAAIADEFAAQHGIAVAEADDVGSRIVALLLAGSRADVEVEV